MKFLLPALVSLTVSLVSAQDYNTSAPFALKLESSNANVSETYLESCHSGAAIEQLCLGTTSLPSDDYGTYFLNVSTSSTDEDEGILVWNLPTDSINVSSALQFSPSLYTNVVYLALEPSTSYTSVAFDEDDKMFLHSSSYDDSTFVAGERPAEVTPVPLYHWYACYTLYSSYYYQTLNWVSVDTPHNPTCVAVNVTREWL